jgi:hypothetical protein
MSFFPILKAPNVSGYTTLCNFPPNNWEINHTKSQFISLTYMKDNMWHSDQLGILNSNDLKTFYATEIEPLIPDGELPLLSLSEEPLPKTSKQLPALKFPVTTTPWWRATLGLSSQFSTTSYQGELPAFPPHASLLSFAPFLQFGLNIENYILIVNLESEPVHRSVEIEIYDAKDKILLGVRSIKSNQINIISLDDFNFNEESLPVIVSRSMSFIPLYFSATKDGKFLSLEHTHQPASLVTHGDRFGAQKHIKELWFSQL